MGTPCCSSAPFATTGFLDAFTQGSLPSTDRPGPDAHPEPAARHRFRVPPTIADLGRAGAPLEVPKPSNCTPCTPISVASRSAALARPIEITKRLRRSAGEKVAPTTPERSRGQSQRPQLRSGPGRQGWYLPAWGLSPSRKVRRSCPSLRQGCTPAGLRSAPVPTERIEA